MGLMICLGIVLTLGYANAETGQKLVLSTVQDSDDTIIAERVLREAYGRLGIDLEVRRYPGSVALEKSNAGEVDGELQRIDGITRRFQHLIQVPIPVNYIQGTVFSKQKDLDFTRWHALRPYQIGIVKGILFAERGTRGMQVKTVDTYAELIQLLATDQVDVIVAPRINLRVVMVRGRKSAGLEMNGVLETFLLYHYLHEKHKDLVVAIQHVLKKMLLAGEMVDIRDTELARLLEGGER